ncbi:MAG: hypothetical protein ACREQ5_34305, partial [Candidatus Dormibacteria bacterium]
MAGNNLFGYLAQLFVYDTSDTVGPALVAGEAAFSSGPSKGRIYLGGSSSDASIDYGVTSGFELTLTASQGEVVAGPSLIVRPAVDNSTPFQVQNAGRTGVLMSVIDLGLNDGEITTLNGGIVARIPGVLTPGGGDVGARPHIVA